MSILGRALSKLEGRLSLWRNRILYPELFAKGCSIGPGAELVRVRVEREARFAAGCSVRDTSIGFLSGIGRGTKVTHARIGRFCAVSWDTTVGATAHPHGNLTINAFPYVPYAGGFVTDRVQDFQITTIGHDVWIGSHALVMPGISIGHGAIIGGGAVVTKDVEPFAIVAGVPAKPIGWRFPQDIREALLELRWWDWDRSTIKRNLALFQGPVTQDTITRLREVESRRG